MMGGPSAALPGIALAALLALTAISLAVFIARRVEGTAAAYLLASLSALLVLSPLLIVAGTGLHAFSLLAR